MSKGDRWQVTASSLYARKNPDINSTITGGVFRGDIIVELDSNGEWIKHSQGWSHGAYLKLYAYAAKVETITEPTPAVTQEEIKEYNTLSGNDTDGSGAYVDPSTVTDYYAARDFEDIVSDESSFYSMDNVLGVFGLPYQFLPTTDSRTDYTGSINETGIGIEYADKIISKMPILFMAPGRANFMTKFSKKEKENVLAEIIKDFSSSRYEAKLEELLNNDGRYYTFDYALSDYYSYVNPMCRIAAEYLELQDFKLDGFTKLDRIDWSEYTIDHITSLNPATCVDYAHIPFYIDTDTSVSESFGNSITESSLASTVNGISDLGRELRFLTGYGSAATDSKWFQQNEDVLQQIENINDQVKDILGSGNFLSSLTKHMNTVASGGRLTFPEIWSDSDFSRSFNITIKLVSPDANKLSIYLNILVPLFHLIGLVAPQSIPSNPNGYTNPFIVRAIYKSFFNVDMGIITDMSVNKGGNCMWTVDGLPTSIEVSLTIKDLYNVMSITNSTLSNFSYDTMSNTAQMDYIANLCGINMYKPEIGRQISMWLVNNTNKIIDAPRNIWRNINQSVGSAFLNIFRHY